MLIMLIVVGLALAGSCAALLARAVALPRLRSLRRLESLDDYGFHARVTAPAPARPLAGAVDGLARAVGNACAGRLKGLSEAEMRRELMSAGLHRVAPVTFIGYRVLAAIGLGVMVLWLGTSRGGGGAMLVLAVPVVAFIGWLAPITIVRRRARGRLENVDYDLPELVDLLVVAIESGMGFAGSLQMAADRMLGPLGDELRLAQQEQAMGLPIDQALAHMQARADTDGMRSFVRTIRQGESLGVSIGQIMRDLASEMRQRRRMQAEARAQRAPIKILFPLVALIFPAIFVVVLAPGLLSIASTFGATS